MAYKKPTKENVEFAVKEGWSREDAERGYTIFDYDGLGLLQIEAICDCYPDGDYDDDACAREAERSGYCRIIPIGELPENFEANGHSVRWFGWIDTPENRKAIKEYCDKLKEYLKGDNNMAKLYTANKETGTFIDKVDTVKQGLDMIAVYEWEDKANDCYEPDFYDVVDENHCSVI